MDKIRIFIQLAYIVSDRVPMRAKAKLPTLSCIGLQNLLKRL